MSLQISSQFNRFYHGVVLNQVLNAKDDLGRPVNSIQFRDWKDTNTGGALTFYKHEDYYDIDDLKEIFKVMNLDYPIESDGKVSTKEITQRELSRHIEWVLKIMGENFIELDFVREEWDRILKSAGIER